MIRELSEANVKDMTLYTYDRYIRRWETKDLWLGPMAHVAEAPRKSVGPGFELGRWSFFSCRLPLEQCLQRSLYNVKDMLLSVAWRNVRDDWRKEMHEKPKLSMMKLITECEVKSSCTFLKSKAERRMVLKLRGGTAACQIEMGRWHGLKREEWMCKERDSGEVEDVCHWLLQCSAWNHL